MYERCLRMAHQTFLRFDNVNFTYDSMTGELLSGVTLHFSCGWTGIVGPNGAGKTTLLFLACGKLQPDHGFVSIPELVRYCPQRTDDPPEGVEELMAAQDRDSLILKADLDLKDGDLLRWESLSFGERSRLSLALLAVQGCNFLLLDEPVNHLDIPSRERFEQAMARFRGTVLAVVHDRYFIERLATVVWVLEGQTVRTA